MALKAGSIAFTGFNADGNDDIAFVVLEDIPGNTVIFFSDNEWNGQAIGAGGGFNSGESFTSWTAPAGGVAAGTVITLSDFSNTVTANIGTGAAVTVSGSANRGIAASGETIYVYVGTSAAAPTTFLAAVTNSTFSAADGPLTNTGLAAGSTALALTPIGSDVAAYTGARTGQATLAGYAALLNTAANWITQDASGDQSADGTAPDVPFSTAGFSAAIAETQSVTFAAASLNVALAEGNTGATAFSFTVQRSGGTQGDVAFSGQLASATANSADFIGAAALPIAFSGTIPAGSTSASVTINVAGDVTVETDEAFTLTLQSVSNTAGAAVATASIGAQAAATGTILNDDAVTPAFDLSRYVRVGRFDLPEPTRTTAPVGNLLAQEASAVAYDKDTDTLFVVGDGGTAIVQVSKTGQLIDTMTLAAGGSPQGTEFYDPEGITYVGGGKFVITEERDRQAVLFTYAAGTTLTRANTQTVKLGTTVGNIGLEGVSYDPQTSGFIFVKETQPEGIFQTTIDFAHGTASNGSPTTVNAVNLFDPALAGVADFADVFSLSNVDALAGTTASGHVLILSQESGKVVEVDRSGNVLSTLTIRSDPGNPLSVVDQQHEGLTMDGAGNLYIVSENGGGDINHPQLWVYALSTAPNQAPTALSLSNLVSTLAENSSTTVRLKLADLTITDDGLGNNVVSVGGPDAAFFEADSTGLYLKAGVTLDFETKSSYAITVIVDDPTVGATPDATAPYTLTITDVINENPAAPVLFISEVAPWSSGNSPVAADWFEVTNNSSSAINITGWRMDDNSDAFGSSVALTGITSIAAGESVIFIETANAATVSAFRSTWFGSAPPAGLQIGTYSGSGVGLSTGGDHVNLFDAAGVLQAKVLFGASPAGPFPSFDNAAGLNNTTISALSVPGVNGAFTAAADAGEIGSPGRISNPIMPVINEFVFNHIGTDTNEYIEIKAAPNADLSGYRLVLIEGDAASSARGVVISLLTPGSANASGYWVSSFLNNQLQNGAQTLLLVKDPTSLAAGQDLDTNNDGVLDATPWGSVVDGVALSTGTAGDLTYLGTSGVPVLTPGFDGGNQTVGGASRLPDGIDTNTSLDWVRNDFDQVGTGAGTPAAGEAVNTPGTANAYAVAPVAGFQISPGAVTVTEGGATATFSVRLTAAPTANVTISVSGNADVSVSAGSLVFTPANYNAAQTVTVTAVDDLLAEGTETTSIILGNAISADPNYSGLNPADVGVTVIDNEPVPLTAIHTIQGAAHTSPLAGQTVRTSGIVTALDTTSGIGFWIQDPNPDNDDATSEGIFVFTNSAASLPAIGDAVTVVGTVAEFLPGNASGNLTSTELTGVTVTVQSSGNALPAATIIGSGGRIAPKSAIYNDAPGNLNTGIGDFDPANEGIDFFESLEGMRVQLNNTVAVGPTNSFGETWVLPDLGAGSSVRSLRGGILLGNGDDNPERIQLQYDSGVLPGGSGPNATVNDKLGAVTGIVSYDFGNYEVRLTASPIVTSGGVSQEKTSFVGDATRLTVAEWNVENLDPSDPKFDEIARLFVDNLKKPDVVALQEIQDNNGATDNGVTEATLTAAKLIAAIYARSGVLYSYADIPPANDSSGGEPGGNIRPGYLYNSARVALVPGSLRTITDTALTAGDAFANSRQPLVADFRFNNQNVTLIDVHSSSKSGSGSLYGSDQPAVNGAEAARIAQATEIKAVANSILAANPSAKLGIMGDFNEFAWNASQQTLTGGASPNLFDMATLLPTADRYSYVFDGNTQQLDHTLGSSAFRSSASYDIVHLDAEFPDATRVSDHDPSLVRLSLPLLGAPQAPSFIGGPATATNTFLMESGATVTGGAGADLLIGRPGTGTLAGAGGHDLFAFINGLGGGTVTISDFTSADHATLLGFGATAVQDALATRVVAGGNTTITLADSTHVVFAGVTNLVDSNFL